MTPEQLISQIRSGQSDRVISEFIQSNPGLTLEGLAVHALQWNIDEVTEQVLRALIKEQPDHAIAHDHLAQLLYRQTRVLEAKPHCEAVTKKFPERSFAWTGLCMATFLENDLAGFRDAVRRAQEAIPEGEHLNCQHGRSPAGFFSDDEADRYRARYGETIEQEIKRRIDQPVSETVEWVPSSPSTDDLPIVGSLLADTGGASEIGTNGATIVGKVASREGQAEYRFEFGFQPGDLNHHTAWAPVPGRLNARAVFLPYDTPSVFRLYGGALSWGQSCGNYVLDWPFGKDPNHISGIGYCDLVFGCWHNSCQHDGYQKIELSESSDLRDAKLTLRFNVESFDPRDFLHSVGVGNGPQYWFLTSEPMDLSCPNGDRQIDVSFKLSSDPRKWTFAGNNPDEQVNSGRYRYGPLDATLGQNEGNIVMAGLFGNWRDTPTGAIAIEQICIQYRDRNVLNARNGAELIRHPDANPISLEKLTDGNRGDLDAAWYHLGPIGEEPLHFHWRLAKKMRLSKVVLHQDLAMPVKRCCLIAYNGDKEVWTKDVEFAGEADPLNKPPMLKFAPPDAMIADSFALDILEAESDLGCGLQTVEVFSENFVPPPSDIPVTVSADIGNLPVNSTLHYRIVCRAGGEVMVGDERELKLPASDAPKIHSVRLWSNTGEKKVIHIRCNPMGNRARLEWRLSGEDGWRTIPVGWENTAIDRYLTVRDEDTSGRQLEVRISSGGGGFDTSHIDL